MIKKTSKVRLRIHHKPSNSTARKTTTRTHRKSVSSCSTRYNHNFLRDPLPPNIFGQKVIEHRRQASYQKAISSAASSAQAFSETASFFNQKLHGTNRDSKALSSIKFYSQNMPPVLSRRNSSVSRRKKRDSRILSTFSQRGAVKYHSSLNAVTWELKESFKDQNTTQEEVDYRSLQVIWKKKKKVLRNLFLYTIPYLFFYSPFFLLDLYHRTPVHLNLPKFTSVSGKIFRENKRFPLKFSIQPREVNTNKKFQLYLSYEKVPTPSSFQFSFEEKFNVVLHGKNAQNASFVGFLITNYDPLDCMIVAELSHGNFDMKKNMDLWKPMQHKDLLKFINFNPRQGQKFEYSETSRDIVTKNIENASIYNKIKLKLQQDTQKKISYKQIKAKIRRVEFAEEKKQRTLEKLDQYRKNRIKVKKES